MCGITGFVSFDPTLVRNGERVIAEMTSALAHRGPDSWGVWRDDGHHVVFGHRRLAIVDLSPEGHQPMISASGRYAITYNGEVYNFRELRAELEKLGHRFRSTSDTEVMLAAFDQWGIESAVTRFVGMFAFAVWDAAAKRLILSRDRLGKKPLYYVPTANGLAFASELKALMRFPGVRADIDRSALALLLKFNYIPAPHSIYQGVRKQMAATLLTVQFGARGEPTLTEQAYWKAADYFCQPAAKRFSGAYQDALAETERLLADAVRLRMVADVPVGAFLSGGYDSSVVVAKMQAQSARPVKTFTIGFHEHAYNEAEYAKQVAEHLRTDHTELYVAEKEAMDVIPQLPHIYDEPFSDSSQIPTYLVSKLARQKVTVALSGDGGDELFCGYSRYFVLRQFWEKVEKAPYFLRRAVGAGVCALPLRKWDPALRGMLKALPRRFQFRAPGERVQKLARVLSERTPHAAYLRLLTHWNNSETIVRGAAPAATFMDHAAPPADLDAYTEYMMLADLSAYLADDILVKVDRASMAVSLETRAPLLDHRLVEFAASLPLEFKLAGATGKRILRDIAHRHIPQRLLDRPKVGFGVPIDSWLRTGLAEWAEELLSPQRLRNDGYFDVAAVRKIWEEHKRGTADWHYWLWDVLMFQSWLDRQPGVEARAPERVPQLLVS